MYFNIMLVKREPVYAFICIHNTQTVSIGERFSGFVLAWY